MYSIRTILTLFIFILLIGPSLIIGMIGYKFAYDKIRQLEMKNVGAIAEIKHDHLVIRIVSIRNRAENFVNSTLFECYNIKNKIFIRTCAETALRRFVKNENAIAAILFNKNNEEILRFQKNKIIAKKFITFKEKQLAEFTRSTISDANNGEVIDTQFYIDSHDSADNRIVIVYSSLDIQKIFDSPSSLGKTGESFLANSGGLFLTQPKYSSVQGHHEHPISARPMQKCLNAESTEVLDEDYRGADVIHGFKFVPEIGGGCIMAHIEQAEAFASLNELLHLFYLVAVIVLIIILITSFWLGKTVTKKIISPYEIIKNVLTNMKDGNKNKISISDVPKEFVPVNSVVEDLVQAIQNDKAQLSEVKSWSDFILANIDDAIIEVSLEGKIIEINKKVTDLFGLKREELIQNNINIIIDSKEFDFCKRFIEKSLNDISENIIESEANIFTFVNNNGNLLSLKANIKKLIKENQIVFVIIIKDLTQQFALEKQIETEKAIAFQSSKNVALAQLTSTLAHEFNSPLSAILLGAKNLETAMDTGKLDISKIKKYVDQTVRIVQKMSLLISTVKKIGWVNNANPDKVEVSIGDIIDNMRILSDAIIRSNGIHFECLYKVPSADLVCFANQNQIIQVFMNLINNSIEAILGKETSWIKIEISKQLNMAQIKFTDSGFGIPKELEVKIFDPFFSTKNFGGGNGIGLSVSRRIIEDHGGTLILDLESVHTSFVIKIPLV